mgnify:CR=1 FL=1
MSVKKNRLSCLLAFFIAFITLKTAGVFYILFLIHIRQKMVSHFMHIASVMFLNPHWHIRILFQDFSTLLLTFAFR